MYNSTQIEELVITINYGKTLRLLRKSRNMSQFKLEAEAGLQFGTICRIEKGKVNPTKETLIKISKALALEIQEILELFGIKVS